MCWIFQDAEALAHTMGFPNIFLFLLFFMIIAAFSQSSTIIGRHFQWSRSTADLLTVVMKVFVAATIRINRNFEDRTHSLSIFNYFRERKAENLFHNAFSCENFGFQTCEYYHSYRFCVTDCTWSENRNPGSILLLIFHEKHLSEVF